MLRFRPPFVPVDDEARADRDAVVAAAIDYYRRFVLLLNARVTDVNVARERRAS